jgi:hypothetical protein
MTPGGVMGLRVWRNQNNVILRSQNRIRKSLGGRSKPLYLQCITALEMSAQFRPEWALNCNKGERSET